jgi:hypothetical protein
MKKLTKKERDEIKMKLAYFDRLVKQTRELIKQGYTVPDLSSLVLPSR